MKQAIAVLTLLFSLALGMPCAFAHAEVVDHLLETYRQQGANSFDVKAGEALWARGIHDANTGVARECTSCHMHDLRDNGARVSTGKTTKPRPPRKNAHHLADAAKIEKWFMRNCKWTLGRECTAQEKGSLLLFIRSR